ncbi:reverse transcriptase [Cucumis melo var. makuwa]|uniref:Reverse transcriptase n=1 Tax=Cucumis melo var. makuwa TaxID=1194695 RepID=A0A5D3CAA9_CUCMM|nr:reverse transcriptase [Cucumis melo var. makuwa]
MSMDVTFLEDQHFFLASHLQGDSTSEETNWSTSSVPNDLKPILSAHDTVLPTEQVPWITYYKKNLKMEMVSPTALPIVVHGYEHKLKFQRKTELQAVMKLQQKNTRVRLFSGWKGNKTHITNEESDKSRDYDISFDMLIALRKSTKYPMYSFPSYNNLSSDFKAFIASLDATTIPKNIHMDIDIPEWKIVVMEETGALEKKNTWDLLCSS